MDTNQYNKYKCPCCGYYTYDRQPDNTYEICEVCFWEDDGLQLDDPNMAGGANTISLNEARINFKKYGACEERFVENVRPPLDEEK